MTRPGDPAPAREAWLLSLIRPDLRPYAERAPLALPSVTALLERIGNPHRGLRCIHIAGSKGKGSVALMTEAILQHAGLRTGTFTSPHLERWSERIRIDGHEVSGDQFDEALGVLKPEVESLTAANPDNPPSFFDTLTAAALWLFKKHDVDLAIVETGIGGRYDATNIVEPEVACITNVELEHTDKLGADLASIARHKAGILKPGARAVLGRFPEPAAASIREAVKSSGCEAIWLGENFDCDSAPDGGGRRLRFRQGKETLECRLAHPSRFMAENAALALACAAALPETGFQGLSKAAAALETVSLPGRAEVLQIRPWIVVDSAHTRASIAELAELLDTLPCTERYFVVSLSGDKPAELLAPLLETATSVTVTSPELLRSMPAERLATAIKAMWPELQVYSEPRVFAALNNARHRLTPDALLCATGSTYLAGAVRKSIPRAYRNE